MILELRRRLMVQAEPKDIIIDARKGGVSGDATNDAALMEVIYAQGWSKSPLYMTQREAEAVTTIRAEFNNNKEITNFSAFRFFSVTDMLSSSLSGMVNLNTIILPESIKIIRSSVLANNQLTTIHLGRNVGTFDSRAFRNTKISSITVDEDNQTFHSKDGVVFTKTALMHYPCARKDDMYVIPDTITTINGYAFYGISAEGLSVNLNNVTTLSNNAMNMSNWGITCELGTLIIPNKVTKIGSSAFRGSGFTKVLYHALIEIPAAVFLGNTHLKTFVIYDTTKVITLGSGADATNQPFRNTHNELKIYVPDELLDSYREDATWVLNAGKLRPLSELPQE